MFPLKLWWQIRFKPSDPRSLQLFFRSRDGRQTAHTATERFTYRGRNMKKHEETWRNMKKDGVNHIGINLFHQIFQKTCIGNHSYNYTIENK